MGINKKYEEVWKSIIQSPKFKFNKLYLGGKTFTINKELCQNFTF